MKAHTFDNSTIINNTALGFSLCFLFSALIAALYTGETDSIFRHWAMIMTSPCPLVTDYFSLGSLGSAFLNAGMCGLACYFFMAFLKGESHGTTLAGFFLVVAHCFYGLNFLNMWLCFLAPFLYFRYKKLNFKSNLHICMFATSFAPFVSEFLFRYTLGDSFQVGKPVVTLSGAALAVCFSVALGYIIPAILPGAHAWHKGYNLFNGGLAFGIFGFFVYNFMYHTMGIKPPAKPILYNDLYNSFGMSYRLYCNLFFLLVFAACLLSGWYLNGKTFKGYGALTKDTGHGSNFAETYGMPLCLVNIAVHGSLFLLYVNLVILVSDGAGFTGPTVGVVLAALTFTAMGQHPKNVWPIMAGYLLLAVTAWLFANMNGRELTWTLSTQAYINGAAFATGLCPISGRYGARAGMAAGFLCASMCTATSALHGGFVLYNGGFTAGLTALILLPILEHYNPKVREEMKSYRINIKDMIALVDTRTYDPM